MKIFSLLLACLLFTGAAAQLTAIGSGVYHYNEAPVKKDSLRETRKFLEGTTGALDFLKHMPPYSKRVLCQSLHIHKKILKNWLLLKKAK
jgi:hypothetical protein